MARGYRFSDTYITKKESSLVAILLVGIGVPWAVAGVMLWVGQLLWVEPPAAYAWVLIAMVAAPLVTVVVVLTVAAILGGRSMSRYGWVLGLVFSLWFFVGLALAAGGVLPWWAYAAGWVVIVALFYALGRRRGVPMWVGGTGATPVLRRYQRSAEAGEEETEQLDDLGRPVRWLPQARAVADQAVAGADVDALGRLLSREAEAASLSPAQRCAAASTVPYLVWRRLARDLTRQHGTDFPRGAARYFTPLYLRAGRSASDVAQARRLCRMSHRAMALTDRADDGTVNLPHHRRDAYADRLVRRGWPDVDRLVAACLTEAVALLVQRSIVLEVAQEARR
ncbi:hypothetical protein AAG589_16720 [Isoptericola sp. F-RaC21]|uniref:hypothetical protein n=1 Tax=Isoptericola sp. F-RaC21 TaxID=3141452 RepID=UPI00315C1949